MANLKKPERILFLVSLTIILLGILVLASVSAVFSIEKYGSPSYLLVHQIMHGLLLGLVLGAVAFLLPLKVFKKIGFWLFLATMLTLAILVFPNRLGIKLLGAARWIDLGLISFQPSEFLKFAIIIYLGAWLSKDRDVARSSLGKRFLGLISPVAPFLLIIGLVALMLVLQPDAGTLVVIAATAIVMFFLAKTPFWQNFLIVGLGLLGLIILIKIAPYRLNRWLIFLHPTQDPMGMGYQLKQSLIAIGSGGWSGLGLGLSRQKYGFLPQTIGDAIFPVFAEEAGFIGAMSMILLFLVFIWQGFRISRLAKDRFSQLVAAGITFWIGFQALVNICSMTGLLPLTGVPLPLISYGGSHLAAEMMGLGLLLNISKQTIDS